MAEPVDGRTWTNRVLFALLAFVLIVVDLVPLDMRPTLWAAPDFLLVTTLVWVARKPSYVPVAVIATLFLITDFLFMRPPGLWTALVVVLTELIRRQNRDFRNMPLLVEWGTMAFGIIAITLINRFVIAVVMTPQPPLGLTLIEVIATVIVYPIVIGIAHFGFGLSRGAPGEIGSRGQVL